MRGKEPLAVKGSGPSGEAATHHRDFLALTHELVSLFRRGVDSPIPCRHFDDLALRAFAYQVRSNPSYGNFVSARGVSPAEVEGWREVPPVPTAAFKEVVLVSGDPSAVQKVFRTSGTTAGEAGRGQHHVLDLDLYRESLLPNFEAHLLPEGGSMAIVALVPSPEAMPDSSLSHMTGEVMKRFGATGSGFFVDRRQGIRFEALWTTLHGFEQEGSPVLMVGTAFAFVHWMDEMDRRRWTIELPPGSRIMETGGFKGRSRTMGEEELYRGLAGRHGISVDRIVNEYGMTELLSQFYEPILRSGGGATRRHVPPPWVRTRVLDPMTLEPVEEGEVGVLQHFDLANLGSVCAILTEDLGVAVGDGFRLVGRAQGAEPRGCSLAMDEFLTAVRDS